MTASRQGLVVGILFLLCPAFALGADMGAFSYNDFAKVQSCGACHNEIFQEWRDSLMSQSFSHEWDQIEYFKLALPHALKLEKVSGVKAGCIACHSPMAFLAGDIPPQPLSAGTRANEGVTCDICHTITGSSEAEPFNFSFTIEPGETKRANRADAESPSHKTKYAEFTASSRLCATCHDEQSPYGAWVKSTYREWESGPYAKEGTRCQDCHMHHIPGESAFGGKTREDVAHHNFHGSHVPAKLAGAVDVALYVRNQTVSPNSTVKITAQLFNGKAGHHIPSGSTEERMLWLEVQATDAKKRTYNLPVDAKGFKGEEYTIADSSAMAYYAMGEILEISDFPGVKRDGDLPDGSRIFRRPFFDPKGRMTICQWYTAENAEIDYRIGPRQTRKETYTWKLPADIAPGRVTVEASLFYSQVPSSVGRFMKLPEGEYRPLLVNRATLELEVK